MAMFFMGANYGGTDVSRQFIANHGAFIGYSEREAQPLYRLMSRISIGDHVVLKAYSPSNGLYIKAVGICTSSELINVPNLGKGRSVKWIWEGNVSLGVFKDCYTNFRTGTIYEELNDDILSAVLNLL